LCHGDYSSNSISGNGVVRWRVGIAGKTIPLISCVEKAQTTTNKLGQWPFKTIALDEGNRRSDLLN
jgi:hypothetical protein